MKTRLKLLTALVSFAVAFSVIITAEAAPPPIPLFIYGNVSIDGNSAPVGTKILAQIDGAEVANITTTQAGKYFMEVPDGKTNENKAIVFKVNGIVVRDENNQYKVSNVATTPSVNFNLAAITPTPTPTPTPAVQQTSGGGGGGGGAAPVNPTPTPTPTPNPSAKKGDANNDNKVDILDFNSLMINWGKTSPGSIADFSGDGKVDIFDFNLLMINWTK